MVTYHVSITAERSLAAAPTVILYVGLDYQEAFDAAVKARGIVEYRGQWIRFADGDLDVVKWAQVL